MCGKQKSIIKFISAVSLFISLEMKVFFFFFLAIGPITMKSIWVMYEPRAYSITVG